jgi:hypothetical protein
MMERIELVKVLFENDPRPEGTEGSLVNINDPQPETEEVGIDPEADAFATSVTMRVTTDGRGLLGRSIAVAHYSYD